MIYKTKRQQLDLIKSSLENERTSFESHWRDLSDFILPRRSRFSISDVNKGDRRNQKIIDSTATLAARTLRSGIMSGVTSPARPWFRLTTQDPDLAEWGPVKQWLHAVQQRVSASYLKSNLYNILPTVYGDLGVFGTAAMSVEEVFNGDVIHAKSFPIGSYWVAKDDFGRINTFVREFRMTVAQLLETFGSKKNGEFDWSNFSTYVRGQYDQGNLQTWIDVTHFVMPNMEYDQKNPIAKFKKFTSCYFESGTGYDSKEDDKYLRESGYDYFPILVPRWETTAEDVYGTNCPGMEALGDIKQLQNGEKRIMEAVDKMIRPPMKGPTSMKGQAASIISGDITYIDNVNGQGFEPVYEVNFRIQEMEMKQSQVRSRIQRSFYEDLFLMLSNLDRRQITAREIEERHEEKLLALGPVLEQINQDLLDPLTDIAFNIHLRQRLLPPPPPELQGMELKVEYISVMAQAQKMLGVSSVERFTQFVGGLAQVDQGVLRKIKADQIVDVYGEMLSVPPSIVRTDEEVQQIIQAEQAQQMQQMQMQQQMQAVDMAKKLSETKINQQDAALDELIRQAQSGGI
mgnify:CR=1 FL=1